MMLTRIVTIALRALQVLFSAVVLGLAVKAVKWQQYGHPPAATGYAVFAGGAALMLCLACSAALFLAMVDRKKPLLLADALAAALLLAGGVAFAVPLRDVQCGSFWHIDERENALVNSGRKKIDGEWYGGDDTVEELEGRCRVVRAEEAFLFFGFVVAAVMVGMGVWAVKREGWRHGMGRERDGGEGAKVVEGWL